MAVESVEKEPQPVVPGTGRLHRAGIYLDRTFQYWALLPALLVLLFLTVYPVIQLITMSFSTVAFEGGQVIWRYTGLENLGTFLDDHIFQIAMRNTVIFVIASVTLEMTLGIFLAILATQVSRFRDVYRTLLIIPVLVPPIAIGTVWRLMYNFEFGVFNQILRQLGVSPQSWLGDASLALPAVVVVDVWHWTAFVFLIVLAGIESLPGEPMEAARVDGASDWQLLRYVVFPLLRSTILVALMFRTLFAFKVFDQIYLLTAGGPGTATEVVSLYINRVFFTQFRMGYGAFLSLVTILLVVIFLIAYLTLVRSRSETQ